MFKPTEGAIVHEGSPVGAPDGQTLEIYEATSGMEGRRIEIDPAATNCSFHLINRCQPTDNASIRGVIALVWHDDAIRGVLRPGEPLAGWMAPVFPDAPAEDPEPVACDLVAVRDAVGAHPGRDDARRGAGLRGGDRTPDEVRPRPDRSRDDPADGPGNRMTDPAGSVEATPATSWVSHGRTHTSPDGFPCPRRRSAASGSRSPMGRVTGPVLAFAIGEDRATTDPGPGSAATSGGGRRGGRWRCPRPPRRAGRRSTSAWRGSSGRP